MSDYGPPPPPSQPPPQHYQVPPPPPPLNLKLLWHSLLWPPGLAVLGTIIFVLATSPSGYGFLNGTMILCVLLCFPIVVGWGLFIYCIQRRYKGFSLVILILAYPLLQSIIALAILFLGCVTLSYKAR